MGTEFTLKGKINRTSFYSEAFREAVKNGFRGSVTEWLAEIDRKVEAGEATSGEYNALLDYKKRERYMKG